MKQALKQSVIHKIMDRASEINKACKENCRDFQIMISPLRQNVLILQYTTIDISNIDNPIQRYHYECFELDGTQQMCSVNYSNQEEANEFLWSLKVLHHQKYAIDHTL